MSEPRHQGGVEVSGGRLACDTAGGGEPAALLVHAGIADRRMWTHEFSILQRERQVVRFDLRGYGGSTPASAPFSYVQDLRTLVSDLGLHRPLLVGSSLGGAIALDYALAYPSEVGGLLLGAPGVPGVVEPPLSSEEKAAFDNAEVQSRDIGQSWSSGDRETAFELLRRLWCPTLEGAALALFRVMVQENAGEVFEDRSAQLAAELTAVPVRLRRLETATTVLIGDRDNPAFGHLARRLASALPRARLLPVRGADHLINLARPEAFESALRSALEALD